MLKPSCLAENGGRLLQRKLDLNLHALFQEQIWLGAGWRSGDAVVGMLEIQVTPELRIGYARRLHAERHPQTTSAVPMRS